ncbi:MAG: hypothetical protein NUW37_06315 [Planctomycetes bacterium]|nr:hypothetical protein [Planctomycetota bacterium]
MNVIFRKVAFSVGLAFLTLFIASSTVRAETADTSNLDVLLENESFRKGDIEQHKLDLLDAFAKNPDLPESIALLRVADALLTEYHPDTWLAKTEGILRNVETNGFTHYELNIYRARLLQSLGRHDEARAAIHGLGIIDQWAFCGPFGFSPAGAMLTVFKPETALSFEEKYPHRYYETSWRKLFYPNIEFDPEPMAFLRANEGCVYLVAQVYTENETLAGLHVAGREGGYGSDSYLDMYVNEVKVFAEKPLPGSLPYADAAVLVNLSAGWNRILVKTTASPPRIRLVDRNGFPLRGVKFEENLVLHDVPADASPAPRGLLTNFASVTSRLDEETDSPALLTARSLLMLDYDRHDEATYLAERAMKLAPESADLKVFMTLVVLRSRHIPRATALNTASGLIESVLAENPLHIPAAYMKIDFMVRNDRYEEALRYLSEIEESRPDDLTLLDARLSIYENAGWASELTRTHLRARELFPRYERPLSYLASKAWYDGRYDYAMEHYMEMNRVNGTYRRNVLDRICAIFQMQGKIEEALSAFQRSEVDSSAGERLYRSYQEAHYLKQLGRFEEAAWALERRLELRPFDFQVFGEIGECFQLAGNQEKALDWYEKLLANSPGDFDLRKKVIELRSAGTSGRTLVDPSEYDFSAPYARDPFDAVRTCPGPEYDPKADSYLVIDQSVQRIYEDGSSVSVIHQLRRIMSERAEEQHSNVYSRRDQIQARVITPEGEVFEPASTGYSLEMTGLRKGNFLEEKFIVQNGPNEMRTNGYGPFFFQDQDFEAPFLVTEWIVIVPEGKDLVIRERFMPVPAEITRPGDGTVVYRWTVTDSKRLERESRSPDPSEFMPHVEIFERPAYRDILEDAIGMTRYTSPLSTRLVRETARQILDESGLGDGADGVTVRKKMLAIYEWVNREIKGSGSGDPHQTILERRGDRRGLFLAMLGSVGVEVKVALVKSENQLEYDRGSEIVSASDLGSPALYAVDGADRIWINMDIRLAPFGMLPRALGGGQAMFFDNEPGRIEFIPTREPDLNLVRTTLTAAVDESGSAHVQGEIFRGDESAFYWNELFKDYDDFRRNQIARSFLSGISSSIENARFEFPNIDQAAAPFRFVFEFDRRAPGAARGSADFQVAVPMEKLNLTGAYLETTQRTTPLVENNFYGMPRKSDVVEIEIDPAFEIVSSPVSTYVTGAFGTYALTVSRAGNTVRLRREIAFRDFRIEVHEYARFVDALRKIDQAEAAAIVLRREG